MGQVIIMPFGMVQLMTYGDGSSMDALTAIDICGHEIGHAVCTLYFKFGLSKSIWCDE